MPTDKRERQREARQARLISEQAATRKAAKRRRLITAALVAVLVLVAAALVARGASDDDEAEQAGTTSTTAADDGAPAPDRREKPEVTVPEGPPPTELVTEDVEVGDGAEATEGATLVMDYVGVAASTGEEFDASFGGPDPFEFQLGAGNVIAGWDQGIVGMKVGGRRQLVIPPDLGYGEAGSPPAIGPNETLVFVVDLLSVTPA